VYCVNNIPSSACECRLYASVDLSQRRGDQWSAILVWDKAGNVSMRAMDVMTTGVITVDPDMSVQAVAKLLSERGISGVPVVDVADRLVGIVSEGDLLHRVETGTERLTGRPRSWWLDTIASDREATSARTTARL